MLNIFLLHCDAFDIMNCIALVSLDIVFSIVSILLIFSYKCDHPIITLIKYTLSSIKGPSKDIIFSNLKK